MRVEDEYLDVLQNLEWAIVNEFRQDRSILDLDARDAVNALVRHYEAEAESRSASGAPLSERARRIFEGVRKMCEWRLGRAPAPDNPPSGLDPTVTAAGTGLCLQRIRQSVGFLTQGG